VHELESQLRAKELERSQAAVEHDRLDKELVDQAARHVDQVRQLKDGEELLKAEFESQRSDWAEWEKCLSEGYEVIDGMLEGNFSFLLGGASCYWESVSYSFLLFLRRVLP
jgi:hypothetical protein